MNIQWQKIGGLLPVVVQEISSGEVLMMAYMNEDALNLSFQSGYAHYFSRTKNRIWKKGEESGNTQRIKSAFLDCDNDTLLLKVEQNGEVACHTGNKSCFFTEVFNEKNANLSNLQICNNAPKYGILDEIFHTCLDRKLNANSQNSYTASLYKKGENGYLKKISEEVAEFSLACKDLSKAEIYADLKRESFGEHKVGEPKFDVIYEGADILFHLIVALADHNIHPENLLNELKRRQGTSGIEEKNSREK